MIVIPTLPIAAQSLTTVLGQQSCAISVYQKTTGLFLDLAADGRQILSGAICRDRVLMVRLAYLGFIGDLSFVDMAGKEDPVFTGLGDRFQLLYIAP